MPVLMSAMMLFVATAAVETPASDSVLRESEIEPSNHQTIQPPNHQTTKPPSYQTTQPGWPESGEMDLSFEQAKIKLGVKAVHEGWSHAHTITLDKDRVLESWRRDGEEMTLMVWRIGAGRTGWSKGITAVSDESRQSLEKGGAR